MTPLAQALHALKVAQAHSPCPLYAEAIEALEGATTGAGSTTADAGSKAVTLEAAVATLQELLAKQSGSRPLKLVVRKKNIGGMSGHQTADVTSIHAGFDHEGGRVILETAKPLTELTPEQVEDITKSVRSGQSWHAYQLDKKRCARIEELEREVAALKGAKA